jgi:hypothetical protein
MKKMIVALLTVVLATGCFQIDQAITLDKNLSGTADFHLGVNFEPMVMIMAQFAREMEGKKGPVTKEELAKAKADFKKSEKKSPDSGKMPSLAEMNKDMPEGVRLLDFKVNERDLAIDTDFKFGFDKLQQLVGLKLPSKDGKGGGEQQDPTKKNIIDSPFDSLELIEKGNTITLRTKPINPAEEVKEEAKEGAPKMDAETEKMMENAFKDLRVTYRITAPFTVVSHNATRKDGNTLIWEYTMEEFEKLSRTKKMKDDDFGVRVTYRR